MMIATRYAIGKIGMIGLIIIMITHCPLNAKMHTINHPHANDYLDFFSWTVYLHRHPGYKNYQIPNDITKNGCQWGAWVTFAQKIEAIQARVGKITHPIALFRSKDFLAMYKHPNYYQQATLAYLVDKRYTLEQKKIAIYASEPGGLCEAAYSLYKAKKIDLPVLELVFAINLGNFIVNHHVGKRYENVLKTLQYSDIYKCLQQITKELAATTSLCKQLKAVLNNHFPEAWYNYIIFGAIAHQPYDHRHTLPFYDIIAHAVKEKTYWQDWCLGGDWPLSLEIPPYFLMVMEHPQYYYHGHFGAFSDLKNKDGVGILRDQGYSHEEKSMAIWGMSQLTVPIPYESENYAFFLEHACEWYRQGQLSVEHLYQLFTCDFPTFYKYPFFILDYKKPAIQEALDKLIAVPTIPEGLKAIARKVKNGTLATKEEMAYMEGYREFRKTHFTLYETILPRGE